MARAGSVARTVGAMAGWGLVHSLLATERAKTWCGRVFGERRSRAGYRLVYNGVAAVTMAGVGWYLHRLPDRRLYRVRGSGRVALEVGRAGLLVWLGWAALEIGVGPFSGFSEVWAYARGRRVMEAPEAQGPSADESGLRVRGPFRVVRHPLNAGAAVLLFLTPEMTEVRMAVAVVTLVYAVVGSKLEEGRLVARYGEAYTRYRERVPFFLPILRA